MTGEAVILLCKTIAPAFGYDPYLIAAMCLQESSDDPTEQVLEPAFYRRYIRPMNFPSTTEALFSCSWGLMQTMGWSLHLLGYFDQEAEGLTAFNLVVTHLLDKYMTTATDQVKYGCAWLKVKELQVRGAQKTEEQAALAVRVMLKDLETAGWPRAAQMVDATSDIMQHSLTHYNGSAEYPPLVMAKYRTLRPAAADVTT